MKFIYVDESGDRDQGDVFVMCGLMVDAYKLRKKTADFDAKFRDLLARHPGTRKDLKTKAFINGKKGWSRVPPQERKDFLTDVCRLAVANGGKLFGIGISYAAFDGAVAAGHGHPFGTNYWLACSMFTAGLVQKKMQGVRNSKGLTVVIMDDNKMGMEYLSDGLYDGTPWFDGLYQCRVTKRKKTYWEARTPTNRFDHIINTAFAIKSDHSTLIQVADVICYIYRRHLELMNEAEAWAGEQAFYAALVEILDPQREKLRLSPPEPCVTFYKAAVHPGWAI